METTDMIDNEKKVYNTPELVEHGNLVETTQGNPSGERDEAEWGMSGPAGIIAP